MNVRHLIGVLHSFSIKSIFYDKMELRLFCFCMMIYSMCQLIKILQTSPFTP